MMTIDRTWPISPSEQLKSQLRSAILSGNLRTGHTLPTVRQLAEELALNPNTIAAAYRDLGKEGLVTKHRRGGTKVAPRTTCISASERQLERMADRLIRLAHDQQLSGADVLRLIAGRWDSVSDTPTEMASRYPIYDYLQNHEHDQA